MKNKIQIDLPKDIEKEKFVLSSMLLDDGKIIPAVVSILSADDFYRPEHRIIFNAISKIYDDKKPVTILTLFEELRNSKDPQGKSLLDLIDINYALTLTEYAHTTAYSIHYAKIIKEKSDYRQLITLGENLIENAGSGLQSPLEIIAETSNTFNNFNINDDGFFNVGEYIYKNFTGDISKNANFFDRKSGFSNIDKFQHWKPGLYILGATPACGKTTFAWQLLEQFAENGENCIFCSYEMSKKELVAKTLARRLFQFDNNATLTAADILNGGYSRSMSEVAQKFFEADLNFTAKKISGDFDINKLLAILRPIVTESDKAPVICIDYLQRLIPRAHKAADTRALIDDALYKLKDFSQETDTTFIVISTFNRTNYNNPVSFENFKESGGIEYTADVVFAMQLNITNKLSGENIGDTRLKIDAAKKQQPRQINIKCLKNRYGNNYDCYFQYFSAHDFFKSCSQESDFFTDSNSNDDENFID